MKHLIALATCLALGIGVVAAQNPPTQNPPSTQDQKMPEVTLTGCLVQGSSPAVFIFENAKKDPKSTTEKPGKYVVVAATEDLNLRAHVTHEVRITGLTDNKPVPLPNQKVEEKDLPKLSATALTMISNTCPTPTK